MSIPHSLRHTLAFSLGTKFLKTFALLVCLLAFAAGAEAATVTVGAGGDLQAALNAAQPGDTIILQAGATYRGPYDLPYKHGDGYITVQSSRLAELPEGVRVTPAQSALMPKITAPAHGHAVKAILGAHHYRFLGVEFTMADPAAFSYQLIILGWWGAEQDTLAEVPHHFQFDRCYVHAHDGQTVVRGIYLSSAHTDITNSHISNFKGRGMDTQAIGCNNGPGPYLIENNFLEGAGENLIFGGDDPNIPGLVPSDITIRRNHFYKPLSWRAEGWTVKNLFELKNARRVVVDGNVFENNWGNAQTGEAILFTVRNQSGGAPWSTVEDVQFTNNVVKNVGGGVNILGRDYYYPSDQTKRITIRNNLFLGIDGAALSGRGQFLMMTSGAADVVVDHNTVLHTGSVTLLGPAPHTGVRFTNNVMAHNEYGVFGESVASGTAALAAYTPQAVFRKNLIAGARADRYPADNFYPAQLAAAGFVDAAAGDYRLRADSPYRGQATDGKDLGCDFDALAAAASNAPAPTPTPAPSPSPTATPVPTPTPSGFASPTLVARALALATALASTPHSTATEIGVLAMNIEQAQGVFAAEARNFSTAEQVDKSLRAALYFARAAASLAAVKTPSTTAQNRLQISALRLQQAGELMRSGAGGGLTAGALGVAPDIGPADTRSSASLATVVAPLSLATVFGDAAQSPLAAQAASPRQAEDGSLPYELGGASVSVGGVAAVLVSASGGRVDFVVPTNVVPGTVEVIVTSQDGFVSRGTLNVAPFAPALFTNTGGGTGAAVALNAATHAYGPFDVYTPEALGQDKRTRLAVFATGFSRAAANTDASNDVQREHGGPLVNFAESVAVEARAADGRVLRLPVEYAGAQGRFPGLDQITVLLPQELRGAGSVDLTILVGGHASNTATVFVQ